MFTPCLTRVYRLHNVYRILTLVLLYKGLLAEMSGNKSDRSLSPTAMNEEGRRELIARQHRALYGNESPAFFPPGNFGDDNHARTENASSGTPTSATGGVRGPSPRSVDPFGLGQSQGQGNGDNMAVTAGTGSSGPGRQSPSRANNTSPSSAVNPSYCIYDTSGEQPVTSTSSPGGATSPTSRQMSSKTTGPIGSVGPIGSRPSQQPPATQVTNPVLNKRSTTPLSQLGFGFAPNETATSAGNERSTSSASNPTSSAHPSSAGAKESSGVGLGWGNGGGVWGAKNSLGVQASVWG
jgi:hypothetical protein